MNTDILEDIFKEFEEQRKIDEEYDKIITSLPFTEFKENHSLIFIGYDYYPPQYDGEKVYTYKDWEGNIIKVFNLLGISIGQILEHEEKFSIVKKRTGYYEFFGNDISINSKKNIIVAFEDEWLEYEDIKQKKELLAEKKRKEQVIHKQMNRNANRLHCDLSGDDLSLLPEVQ